MYHSGQIIPEVLTVTLFRKEVHFRRLKLFIVSALK
jgi:hypothetical protein